MRGELEIKREKSNHPPVALADFHEVISNPLQINGLHQQRPWIDGPR